MDKKDFALRFALFGFCATFASTGYAQDEPPEIDDIIVNGQRYHSPRIYADTGIRIVNEKPVFQSPTTGPQTNVHTCTEKNAKREVGKDTAAKAIALEILAKPDVQEREYATIIIMNTRNPDQPTFRYQPLVAGQTWDEARAAGQPAPRTDNLVAEVFQYDRIIAIVHSHPAVNSPNLVGDRLPSDVDWSAFSTLSASPTFGSYMPPDYAFSHYIVGPDGVLREYRQDAGKPTVATTGIKNGC